MGAGAAGFEGPLGIREGDGEDRREREEEVEGGHELEREDERKREEPERERDRDRESSTSEDSLLSGDAQVGAILVGLGQLWCGNFPSSVHNALRADTPRRPRGETPIISWPVGSARVWFGPVLGPEACGSYTYPSIANSRQY